MNLFAGEEEFPDIACPIQMRWDARGCETVLNATMLAVGDEASCSELRFSSRPLSHRLRHSAAAPGDFRPRRQTEADGGRTAAAAAVAALRRERTH